MYFVENQSRNNKGIVFVNKIYLIINTQFNNKITERLHSVKY